MAAFKFVITFAIAWGAFACYSQDENTFVQIDKGLKRVSTLEKLNPDFTKSRSYFFDKNYDSTLVYANKYLAAHGHKSDLTHYCLFFRGVSLIKKGLFDKARQSFLGIPESFQLYPLVVIKLGLIESSAKEYNTSN